MSAPRKKPSGKHVIVMRALIVIRCACGWFHRIDGIRGKSDWELSNQVEEEFMAHEREMTEGGY